MQNETRLIAAGDCLEALPLIGAGQPVALPTETVYGLAADALDPVAVARIFEAKGRPRFDPLIVHLPDGAWLEKVARIEGAAGALARRLAEAFWPGPLTMVVPKQALIPDIVTAGLPAVAVRMSRHPVFREVCSAFGRPLAAPSANRFGRVSPTSAAHVMDELGGRIPAVVDGGDCPCGIESTIIRITAADALEVLRPGPVTADDLARFAPNVRCAPRRDQVLVAPAVEAPGQLPSHYAPATPLVFVRDAAQARALAGPQTALLAWNEEAAGQAGAGFAQVAILAPGGDATLGAARLFRLLRGLDAAPCTLIVAMQAPAAGLGHAINDRLSRACKRN